MTATPHMGITLLEQAQQQKEVTINEAFYRIDAMLNGGAIDRDLATPPGSPAQGDVYIVAASPTGAWSGKAKHIAYFDQIWRFIAPNEGAMLWLNDENVHVVYNGTAWNTLSGGGGGSGDMLKASYDPANINQQLVGTSASQTLTNKTLTSPVLSAPSADRLVVTGSTAPTNGIYLPAANTVGIASNSTNAVNIDASQRLLVGSTAAYSIGGATPGLQITKQDTGVAYGGWLQYSANTLGAGVFFGKSRNATIGSHTIVNSGDQLGFLGFYGSNGTDFKDAAYILSYVDGTPGSGNDMPGRLTFWTAADGTASPSEAVRIDNAGACYFPRVSTTASAANAFLNSGSSPANSLLRSTSSIAYKKDVEDLEDDYSSRIFELRPVWYRSKAAADNPDWSWYGLIAEEVAQVDPRLVHWSYPQTGHEVVEEEGRSMIVPTYGDTLQPDGVQYERLTVLLLAELRKLKAEVEALKVRA